MKNKSGYPDSKEFIKLYYKFFEKGRHCSKCDKVLKKNEEYFCDSCRREILVTK